jgi:hypothetical protein
MELEGPCESVALHPGHLRSLRLIGYPQSNEVTLRTVVLWLEEEIIRFYDVHSRDYLRHAATNASLNTKDYAFTVLNKYLADLGCPLCNSADDLSFAVANLIRFAVALHYHDNAQQLNRAGTLNFLSSVKRNDSSKRFNCEIMNCFGYSFCCSFQFHLVNTKLLCSSLQMLLEYLMMRTYLPF